MSQKNGIPRQAWFTALALSASVGIFAVLGLAASPDTGSAVPATDSPTAEDARRDFDFYRQNVEPMFVRPRGYPDGGGNAACVMCHVWQTSLRLALENMTEIQGSWEWTEEQSMRNYETVTRLVNASDPASSKLLRKPLAPGAGGEVHTGGTYWESTDDPEYQVVLEWIELLPPAEFTPPPAPPLDFAFYRSCVQQVFADPREGHLPCTRCHAGGSAGFAPAPANGSSWTEQEARRGFEVIQRLIVPGNPEESRWMLKPLHPDGGGSYTHNGVRRWQSRDDPEWQMLAEWIRGERTGNSCSM